MMREKVRQVSSGYGVFMLLLAAQLGLAYTVFGAATAGSLYT